MRTLVLVSLIAAGTLGPTTAFAEPERKGFTLELGIGGAATLIADGGTTVRGGLAPLSASLGAFATPDLALMFRLTGTSFFQNFSGTTAQIGHNFYGLSAQYWIDDAVFVGGGVGVALYDDNVLFSGFDYIDPSIGLGFDLRAGYCVGVWTHHALAFSLELLPAIYQGAVVVGAALQFQWQYY